MKIFSKDETYEHFNNKKNNMKIDMHFHSTESDGRTTKEELLTSAKNKWLDFIALTDHDIVSYWFREEAKKLWISSCQSVEISAYNKAHDKSLHIALYAWEIWKDINGVLENIPKSKALLIEKQIEHLQKLWFYIIPELFYSETCSSWRKISSINKSDLAYFLFKNQHNRDLANQISWRKIHDSEDFYQSFFKRGWEYFDVTSVRIKDYEPHIEDCKSFKEKTDWILSLVHPNVTFKRGWIEEFKKVLPHYIEVGWINAIEINAQATKDWVIAIMEAKSHYWLYITLWSDNHEIWISDRSHWNFWEINTHVNNKALISSLFSKYRDKIS